MLSFAKRDESIRDVRRGWIAPTKDDTDDTDGWIFFSLCIFGARVSVFR
jgi:hypothetical protein